MNDAEENVQEENLQPVLPEVVLIGILLLFWGVYEPFRVPASMPFIEILRDFEHNTMETIVNYALGMASIIMGIGLFRSASWARRGTIILIFCYFAKWALMPMILMVLEPLSRANDIWFMQPLEHPAMLIEFAQYAILLLFIEAPHVRHHWKEERRPGLLTDTAEMVLDAMPTTTPYVLVLIALLLFCWAGGDLLLFWRIIAVWAAPNRSFLQMLLTSVEFLFFLGYIAAGIGLLWHHPHARKVAITMLILTIIHPFGNEIFRLINWAMNYGLPNYDMNQKIASWIISALFITLISAVIPLILIIFVARERRQIVEITTCSPSLSE